MKKIVIALILLLSSTAHAETYVEFMPVRHNDAIEDTNGKRAGTSYNGYEINGLVDKDDKGWGFRYNIYSVKSSENDLGFFYYKTMLKAGFRYTFK